MSAEHDDWNDPTDNAVALLQELLPHAGDLDAVADCLRASRAQHGLDEHRRITECAALILVGLWAQPTGHGNSFTI